MYPHTPKKKSLAPPEGTLDILIFTQNRPSRTLPTFFRQGILIGGPILYVRLRVKNTPSLAPLRGR